MLGPQAQIIAFSPDYQMVMLFTLCTIPLAIIIGSTKVALEAGGRAGTRGDGVISVVPLARNDGSCSRA
jgi:hypothetical protein